MIQSKEDYYEYLKADQKANRAEGLNNSLLSCRIRGGGGYIILYLWYLRRLEYTLNCKKGFVRRLLGRILIRRLNHWSAFLGISIAPNSFGKGLIIPHWGAIVIAGSARFGDNCVLQCGCNVSADVKGGNHIYLSTGSKVLRNVRIADDVIVAANAVVNKDVLEDNIVVGGIPAKKISDHGYRGREEV